jgi:hypothetical protein
MASIINASSTGSGGLISTGDASGVLQLQSNGTVVLTVNTSNQMVLGATGGSVSGSNSVGKESIYKPIDTTSAPFGTRMIDLYAYYPGYENTNPSATIFAGVDAATSTANGYLAVQTINSNVLSEAVRFNQYGTVVLKGGTVNGGGVGICFPATQDASSNANTLDDYEEGTFTPTVAGASSAGTATYSQQEGYYVKIGGFVKVYGRVAFTGSTGSGRLLLKGLPFANVGGDGPADNGYWNYGIVASGYTVTPLLPSGATNIDYYQYAQDGGSTTQLNIAGGGNFTFGATYRVS